MKNYKQLKELSILVAEDEVNLALLLTKAISDYFRSFKVVNCANDALNYYKQNKPDLVITDIMMPDISGLELCSMIKNINEKANIIVLSAYSDKDKLLSAIDVGVRKYFIKPFDPEELLDYILSIAPSIRKDRIVKLDGDYHYNYKYKKLTHHESSVSITKREINFIELLLEYRGKVVSEEKIKRRLWEEEVSDERLRTFIKRLRFKTSKSLVRNVLRQGYCIELS